MGTETARRLYNIIISKDTLEEQRAEYTRLMNVRVYKIYKDEVDELLMSNGYSNVIVTE